MKYFTVELDGRSFSVPAERLGGRLWFHWQGRTYAVESEKSVKKSGARDASGDPSKIVAPMPGKIIKVCADAGQKIAANEVVVVMEAMKMEYSLKAVAPGTVKKVHCHSGDQVPVGQLLAEIEL